ncbi:hypothetical protein D9758_003662 [Tetrapyrgos nigripes]|uniref:Glutaredoxin domain-containing protein n=1 Tax=Tetrapyrgos nigripes TaxID=182062 RepID=A0A8H5GMT9_9AGAR|nr:hypothetical protein D9758_003662 [Tetrapyrgos nigripes]
MLTRFFSSFFRKPEVTTATKDLVESAIADNKVVVFSKSYCPYCHSTKKLFKEEYSNVPTKVYELDLLDEGSVIQLYLQTKTGQRTVPNIFINKQHIGGNSDVQAAFKNGKLSQLLES